MLCMRLVAGLGQCGTSLQVSEKGKLTTFWQRNNIL